MKERVDATLALPKKEILLCILTTAKAERGTQRHHISRAIIAKSKCERKLHYPTGDARRVRSGAA
eukprot:3025369-Pyramimonas_sp.AAC.1